MDERKAQTGAHQHFFLLTFLDIISNLQKTSTTTINISHMFFP